MMLRNPVAGIVGALRAMRDRPDSTPVLRTIRVPTLVLVGADDAVTPPATAQALADAIPGARLVTIDAAGHLAPLEQPLSASRAMAEFLDGLR
jgi:pimeloyl-ACP methyl ester carboxylesterase